MIYKASRMGARLGTAERKEQLSHESDIFVVFSFRFIAFYITNC